MHTYMHIGTHMHTYMHAHTYKQTYIQTCYACTCMPYMGTYMPTHPGAATAAVMVKSLDLSPSYPLDSMVLCRCNISTQDHHLHPMESALYACCIIQLCLWRCLPTHMRLQCLDWYRLDAFQQCRVRHHCIATSHRAEGWQMPGCNALRKNTSPQSAGDTFCWPAGCCFDVVERCLCHFLTGAGRSASLESCFVLSANAGAMQLSLLTFRTLSSSSTCCCRSCIGSSSPQTGQRPVC